MDRVSADVDRARVVEIVRSSVEEHLLDMALPDESSAPSPQELEEDTVIFGREGFLDSLGLVTLVLSIEQQVNDEFGVTISIADDRAMSQKNSPFRTIGRLSDYVSMLVGEASGAGVGAAGGGDAVPSDASPS
jgi:acyl carrier protein